MKIEPFGEVNADDLKEYYEAEVNVLGSSVEIDLNFESDTVDTSILKKVSNYTLSIDSDASKAFEAVSKDWDLDGNSETARHYMQHHLDNFTQDEIDAIFPPGKTDKEKFMGALSLVRIGLYPEDAEAYAIYDIQFPEEQTNYLMAVTFNEEHEVSYISMDS